MPYETVTLYAKVAGYLKNITVDKGDRVRAGQVIADVEVPELLAERAQYEAQIEVAQAEYNRVRDASHEAPDLVVPERVDEALGKLKVAQAQLQRTDTLLKYANIVAPFAGTITARYVDPGAFIAQATNGTQQNSAVVTLMDFRRVRIQVPVPESDALAVQKGTRAVISGQGLQGREFRASVSRISYALDPNAKTMLAEIDLDNPNELLRPGMYVSVQLTLEPKSASGNSAPAVTAAK
jgi:membrane fusion protein, multidrug efflux system